MSDTSFAGLIERAAGAGGRAGIADPVRFLSYGALAGEAAAVARALSARGDYATVALLLPRSVDFLVALAASSRLARTTLIFGPTLGPAELQRAATVSGPELIVASPAFAPRARMAAPAADVATLEGGRVEWWGGEGRQAAAPLMHAETPLAVLYTSGTTGAPKGIVHSQGRLIANAAMVADALGLGPHDVGLVGLPLSHAYGLNHVLAHAAAGARCLLTEASPLPGLFAPPEWWAEVTNVPLVPTTLKLVVGAEMPPLPRLRLLLSAGGPLGSPLATTCARRFPGVPLLNNYGQTEAGPRVTVGRVTVDAAPGFVGQPLPGVSVQVLGGEDSGEIAVQTPTAMLGYLGAPEETARTLDGGWLRTGDLGRLDAAGGVHITGRLSEVVHCAGVRVAAREIEEALLMHPGVAEAAVVAVPHGALGEVAKAFVIRAESGFASERELKLFCRRALAPAKVPRQIVIVDALPRTAAGKVMKVALR